MKMHRSLVAALTLLAMSACPAWAADEAAQAAPEAHRPGQVLAAVLLAIVLTVGVGCLLAVLRVIFPGPARLADAGVARLDTGRLLLTGLLPVVGAGLLGAAAEATHVQALVVVWCVVILLPIALLMLVGAMACVPHLGAGLLKDGEQRSLLARAITGALVLGLASGAAAALRPLAPFVGVILAGWFLGAGLGVVFRPREAPEDA